MRFVTQLIWLLWKPQTTTNTVKQQGSSLAGLFSQPELQGAGLFNQGDMNDHRMNHTLVYLYKE